MLPKKNFCANAPSFSFAQLRPIGACAANLFTDTPARVAFFLQKSLIYAIIEQKL
jgi:hypothetical protein